MKENSSSSELERKVAPKRSTKNIEDIRSRKLKGINQGLSPFPQNIFRKETISRWNRNVFNSYWHSCNKFGHKDLNCRSYVRRNVGKPSNPIRCWTCNQIGHTIAYCQTIICYNCSEIGHKAQNCWNSKGRSTRRSPYNPIRNVNEI